MAPKKYSKSFSVLHNVEKASKLRLPYSRGSWVFRRQEMLQKCASAGDSSTTKWCIEFPPHSSRFLSSVMRLFFFFFGIKLWLSSPSPPKQIKTPLNKSTFKTTLYNNYWRTTFNHEPMLLLYGEKTMWQEALRQISH